MISNIFEYDSHVLRNKKDVIIILSFDKTFKEKIIEQYNDALLVGFSENEISEIKNFEPYFSLFMKIIPEVKRVIIDCNDYSIAFSMIQYAALLNKNVKEVILYADSNTKDFKISDESSAATSFPKEKTHSRQGLLNSRSY